jgi:hypothetical protein
MLSVTFKPDMLSVVMMNVVMLSVIMLGVVAPTILVVPLRFFKHIQVLLSQYSVTFGTVHF